MLLPIGANQHTRGDSMALLGLKDGMPKDGVCGTPKGEGEGRGREGIGGSLCGMGAAGWIL